jgi:hypothetical protein
MAVSSLLSPEKIARSPRGTIQSAQNFISGGSPIGGSVVESAANKIIGFERAQVKPISPDINSIISSITNNVLSSVDNTIKSATQIINNNVDNKITNVTERLSNEIQTVRSAGPVTQLQNIVQVVQNKINQSIQKVIGDFSNDYAQKIRNIEENKPSQVLDKFLKVYRNALEFIQFFGNQKNVDRLKSNLVALKTSFNESFEVAKLVRQVIVKIVNQLSNLPRATPSGGGLNLDVNVPGSPLKKAGAPAMKGMGRGKMLGLGALGLGAAGIGGGMAVNALADSDQVQPQQVQTDIPQNLVDRFGAVIDRFSNILDSLVGKKKEENITVSSPGSPSSPPSPKTKPSGTQGSPGVQIKDDAQGLTELGLSQKEWDVYKQGIADVEGAAYTQMGGAGGRFAGRYQMGDEAITEAAKVLGLPKPSRQEFLSNPQLQEKMYMGYTISNFRYMQSLSPEFKNMTREQQLAVLPMAQLGIGNLAEQLRTGKISKDAWGTPTTKFSEAVKRRQKEAGLKPFGKNIPSAEAMKSPQVSVSPAQTQVAQQRAESVSQPPPTQVASSVNVLPIDLSSAQQQSGGGGGQVISSPPSQKNGPSIPMLPSSNPDNFLVLYSKIVYNVVDG